MTTSVVPNVAGVDLAGVHGAYIVNTALTAIADGTVFTSLLSANGYQQITSLATALVDTDGPIASTGYGADTTNSLIIVPSWANWVWVTGHISFALPALAGMCSVHLWRSLTTKTTAGNTYYTGSFSTWNDGNARPTPEAHYHNRATFDTTAAGTYRSVVASTGGWIPVMGVNEKWYLVGAQTSGASVNTQGALENWLSVMFKS